MGCHSSSTASENQKAEVPVAEGEIVAAEVKPEDAAKVEEVAAPEVAAEAEVKAEVL